MISVTATEILSAMKDRIKNVEVYYNPYTTKVRCLQLKRQKIYNIVNTKRGVMYEGCKIYTEWQKCHFLKNRK